MKKSSKRPKENKSSKMDKNNHHTQEQKPQQHTNTSKSTPVKQRTARIRPESTKYIDDIVKANKESKNAHEDSEIFRSAYPNNLSNEPEHIGTVYARINECNSEENEGEELCDNSTEDITNTTKDLTTNDFSGDNKNSGDNSGNSGDTSNFGEPVVINGEKYKYDKNYIRELRKIEDEARHRHENLENLNSKSKNKDKNNSDKNSNSKIGSNDSKNSKLYKIHIEKPDHKSSENSNEKNDKKGTSGYKTNSKTNSGSKVNSEQKNSNGKTVNSGPTTGSIEVSNNFIVESQT